MAIEVAELKDISIFDIEKSNVTPPKLLNKDKLEAIFWRLVKFRLVKKVLLYAQIV